MEKQMPTEVRIASGEKFRIGVIVYSKEPFAPTHKNESGSPLAQVTLSNNEKVWIYTTGVKKWLPSM